MSLLQLNPLQSPSYTSYCNGDPPTISYLYSTSQDTYLFEDSTMKHLSYIPSIEIGGKTVIFTFNQGLAIHYNQSFIRSISELFQKIQFPMSFNEKLLDKIATMANYLAKGTKYQYVEGTAKEEGRGILFFVKKGIKSDLCQVTLSCLAEDAEICYIKKKN